MLGIVFSKYPGDQVGKISSQREHFAWPQLQVSDLLFLYGKIRGTLDPGPECSLPLLHFEAISSH